jgi:hypothetical protein
MRRLYEIHRCSSFDHIFDITNIATYLLMSQRRHNRYCYYMQMLIITIDDEGMTLPTAQKPIKWGISDTISNASRYFVNGFSHYYNHHPLSSSMRSMHMLLHSYHGNQSIISTYKPITLQYQLWNNNQTLQAKPSKIQHNTTLHAQNYRI